MANTKLINCDQLQAAMERVKTYIDTADGTKAASSHTHGNIANGGTLSTASMVVITDANKKITTSSTITTTELGYLNGVSSNVQTQLDGKAASSHTHGNITNDGKLATASMVVITDANKNITTSSTISTTEMGYLDGVTSNIQTQLNGKAPTSHASTATTYGVSSASNYGHAMASGTTPKANGTAAVGSETAKFARGDHVHPLQTSVSGNAGSADKVNNNLIIKFNSGATEGTNLFTFNGSAAKTVNITPSAIGAAAASHGNHVPTTQTADNTKFLRNDNTWQSVTPANIGALSRQYKTATTAATAGWYRIATSVAGIARNMAMFEIDATVSGKHSETILAAGICYGQAPTLNQLAHTEHSNTGISKARIVYHTTYSSNYAYLEVYVPTATATTLNVKMIEGFGWSLVAPSTAGSIPSGYTNKEITFAKNKIVADFKGTGEFSSLSMSGTIALDNNVGITTKTAAAITDTDGTTVAAGTAIKILEYNGSDNLHLGRDIYQNKLTTGNTYISGGGGMTIRTNAGSIVLKPYDTSVMSLSDSQVDIAKLTYAKAGVKTGGNIISDTALTDNLGTEAIPWATVRSRYYQVMGEASKQYGNLRAETVGTTSVTGETRLTLGNSTATGTASNAYGRICIYGTSSGYTYITPGNNSTSNVTVTLPSATGTLARTADNVASATKVHTTLAATTKAYLLGTATAPTSTSTAVNTVGDTNVYLTTTSGQLHVGSLETAGNIMPTSDGSYKIGDSENRFSQVVAQNVHAYDSNAKHYASLRTVTVGTADTQGVGRLIAGNSTASGTAGNAKGQVLLYGTNTGYTAITPGNDTTSNITLTLPSATGTLISSNQATFTAMPKFNMNDRTGSIFEIFGGDENGHGVRFGGGACTFVGSGESAANIITAESTSATDEQLYLTSDNNIYFYTKCNAIADRNKAVLSTSLAFYPSTAITGSIGHSSYPWSTMYAKQHYIANDGSGTNYGRLFVHTAGTTSAVGIGRITLGNSTASGTANNAQGSICLYGSSSGYTIINPGYNSTSSVTLTLPSSTGTIATTANIDSKLASYLPLAGGTMTGNITLNNGIVIKSKTPAAYTNTNTSASVASGTAVNILTYNSSGNCHVNSGAYDNYLSTGNLYLNSPNNLYLRTLNSGGHYVQINGSSVAHFTTDEAAFAKIAYAKAGIKTGGNIYSDTALTDACGTSTVPWASAHSRYWNLRGDGGGQTYGSLFVNTIGTTSATGESRLTIGNSVASGTANNAQGTMLIYGTSSGYTYIKAGNNTTSNITVTLPSASGKLPIMVTDDADYWGILPPSGNTSTWIRSGGSGFLPYEKNSEISSLGTASWPWYNICGKNFRVYDKNGQTYGYMNIVTDGTTSTQGETRLTLGNNIANGAAKNSYGRISLYGTNTGYTMITPGNNTTSNITLTLPSSGGTLARTADNVASATKLATARTLTIGATGKTFDGTAAVSWSLQEIMQGKGLTYDTACGSLYFNNDATEHKGRISCYNDGTDYVQLALRTSSATVNSLGLYATKTTIGQALYVSGNVTLNNDKDTDYQAFDAHRSCTTATDSTSSTYYAVSDYEYSTARFGCVNSFGGVAAIETRHNGSTVGYVRALPTGGIQIGSGKKLHIQNSAPTLNVATGDVWIDAN